GVVREDREVSLRGPAHWLESRQCP
ncbi:hypothetical protein HaLaN_00231, partial [Haematococcus lacustris]